jgi:DNA gyrase subunit A
MSNKFGKIKEAEITKEMEKSYLDYAMSVIVSRALPDVRDGLKPVHRRILYAMSQMGLTPGGRYTKSAKIVGEVLGKYHPHGDSPVYDALVRMAQNFSMRYPLVDGQGNFGSIDNDPPAAMRYTEARLAKIAYEMLDDLKKETIEFVDNFDGTLKEPTVLPAKAPNLLLNGTDGIAVGMATKIPPHNLNEIADAAVYMLDKGRIEKRKGEEIEIEKIPSLADDEYQIILADVLKLEKEKFEFESETSTQELLRFVKGPDFPTAGQIFDKEAIQQVYLTGKGKIMVRGKAEIEEGRGGKFQIIVSELPYQVNKAELVAKIAELAKDKKIIGISDLRDESDRDGIRIVVELKKSARPKTVLNKLYKHTQLQTSYPANMVALVDGVPQTLNLRQIILLYLRHRHEIVRRRTIFDLKEAKLRSHILEGLKIALDNLDEVIRTIRESKDADTAKENLMSRFKLTGIQATAILDMQLRRLAALERQKIEDEYKTVKKHIDSLMAILINPRKMIKVIKDEIIEFKQKYGDARRTKVFNQKIGEFSEEDLIPNEETIITITKTGYVKRLPKGTFRTQRRGGKGVVGMTKKEEDEIEHLIFAETHDYILFFTNKGRVFQLRVWDLPEGSRQSKGQAVVNLINIDQGESIQAVLIRKTKDKGYVTIATKKGQIKRTPIEKFAHIRSSGIIAIGLRGNDEMIGARLTSGDDQIFLVTYLGKCIRFSEKDVRSMGREAAGVRGIQIRDGDYVVGLNIIPEKLEKPKDKRRKVFRDLLIVTEKGLGKRTNVYLFPLHKRGGVGVKVANLTKKTGNLACARVVDETIKQVVITSRQAQIIKLPLKNIPRLGRATQGVILMRLNSGDQVAAMACLS